MSLFTILLTIVAASLFVYQFFLRKLRHFEKLGVPHDRPIPILGNMLPWALRRTALMEYLQHLYHKYSHARYFGFYNFLEPITVIRDPELISLITTKQFDSFSDHRGFFDEETEPLMSRNLFALNGDHWREMRRVLSPTFTASKMRQMFKLIAHCAKNFAVHVKKESRDGRGVINAKDIFGRYTVDVVASCAFGIEIDSMAQPTNDFYVITKQAMDFDSSLSLKLFLGKNFRMLRKLLEVKLFEDKVERFFRGVVESTVKTREEKGIVRPDMIQLMMESRDKGQTYDMTLEEMTAQAFVFFLAGFDSVSTMAFFLTYEIAMNPDVQTKLRNEIENVLKENAGEPTYEAILQMKYLDAVINEALRLYPLTMFVDRLCVKDFELPAPVDGGKPVTLKAGSGVWIPSFAIHRDPKYFPEPDRFNPDRFLDGHVDPSFYIPFGAGPRFCIGNRFALMELKVLAFYLLAACNVEPCEKTPLSMSFKKKTFIMMPEKGFWLKFRARD